MKKSESLLWQRIKKLKLKGQIFRIESNTINGIADVYWLINGKSIWIELKSNDVKNCGLSKYQINWHIKYQKAGGKSFILNRPLLKGPYKLLAVSRKSRTPQEISESVSLKLLITLLASRIRWQRSAGPGTWAHAHAPASHSQLPWTKTFRSSGQEIWHLGLGSCFPRPCSHAHVD